MKKRTLWLGLSFLLVAALVLIGYLALVVEEPVVEEPVVEEPVVGEPVVGEPVVGEPVVEEPVVGEPVVEEPVVGEPVVEEPVVEHPSVAFIPENWVLGIKEPYPEWFTLGLIMYADAGEGGLVMIYYGDVPSELKGKESDRDALIAMAVYESIFVPTETGTMTIGAWLAGYAKGYDAELDVYEMEIVFVHESTYVSIYVLYVTPEDEEKAMSLIRSIYF